MMNKWDDPSEVADRILDGKFKTHKFPLLEAEVIGKGKYFAMNDVYVKPHVAKAAAFKFVLKC